ncbi:hypothetical protein SUGI_0741870 [Cryptomeria japonica]|nr:hypothetical protein SUGI_0741870 [Cryptomeria japonica]
MENMALLVQNMECEWSNSQQEHQNLVLKQISLKIPKGWLTVIIGKVGVGYSYGEYGHSHGERDYKVGWLFHLLFIPQSHHEISNETVSIIKPKLVTLSIILPVSGVMVCEEAIEIPQQMHVKR